MSPRTYCRLGFLLLCVAPTLAMAGTVISRRVPDWFVGSKNTWEGELSERLGFRVSLGKVTRPHAGTMLFEQVELADRETGHVVVKARVVEAAQAEQGLVIVLSQPEISVEEFGSLANTVHETLLRVSGSPGNIHILANELLLKSPDRAQSFSAIDGVLEALPAGPRATIRFRVPAGAGGEPAQLCVTRNREQIAPSTRWELHTGSEPLPCSILAAYLSPLAMLGNNCEFHGVAWGEEKTGGWEGDVSGRLSKVNLDALITRHFPHKLSGSADVVFNRAHFHGGRLVDAAGSIESSGGVIGRTLVESAAETLSLELADQVSNINRWPIRYSRLAAGFTIGDSGLSLSGMCDSDETVLTNEEGPLLLSPTKHNVPIVSIVRWLSPESTVQVPATAETDALLRALPVPPLSPPTGEPKRPPSSTLRLKHD